MSLAASNESPAPAGGGAAISLEFPQRFHACHRYIDTFYNLATTTELSDIQRLVLYGFLMQFQSGPCKTTAPSRWHVRERAKWEAWNHLGNMSTLEAMVSFVNFVETHINKNWISDCTAAMLDGTPHQSLDGEAEDQNQPAEMLRCDSLSGYPLYESFDAGSAGSPRSIPGRSFADSQDKILNSAVPSEVWARAPESPSPAPPTVTPPAGPAKAALTCFYPLVLPQPMVPVWRSKGVPGASVATGRARRRAVCPPALGLESAVSRCPVVVPPELEGGVVAKGHVLRAPPVAVTQLPEHLGSASRGDLAAALIVTLQQREALRWETEVLAERVDALNACLEARLSESEGRKSDFVSWTANRQVARCALSATACPPVDRGRPMPKVNYPPFRGDPGAQHEVECWSQPPGLLHIQATTP